MQNNLTVTFYALSDFNLKTGTGLVALAGKVWRIGLMGHDSRAENISQRLSSLEAAISEMGTDINTVWHYLRHNLL